MKYIRNFKTVILCGMLLMTFFTLTSAKKKVMKLLPLASVHIVDRNGFTETISNKDRLKQFQQVDFLQPQTYQKVLRIYARDSAGNLRSVVTSYHENGNPKQLLEILNGRACGMYREWHEGGALRIASTVIGGEADITQKAENSWLFDGTSYVWNENGQLIAEIPYCSGSLQGVSIYYHASGKIWKRIPYQKGSVEGIVEVYKDNDQILQQTCYRGNKKQGTSTRYWLQNQIASCEEYSQDRLESGQYFDKQGKSVSRVECGNGFRSLFGKDSISELQEYKNGVADGQIRIFTPQGNLKRAYHIKNDIKHGEEIEYFDRPLKVNPNENGESPLPRSKLLFNWYEGRINGPVKTWYANGQVESQREMADNKKIGTATIWYRDGNLMMIEVYDQNKLVRGDYFRKEEKNPASQVLGGKGIATLFDAEGRFLRKINYVNGRPGE